jgi:hypothetical protein
MNNWGWLKYPAANRALLIRVLVKAALLFVVLNLLFDLLNPMEFIGRLSIYNRLVPGRVRLPYGEDPRAYNLSLNNLEAMFASHEIVQSKSSDEFRVVLIGDSSVWGILLKPEETVAAFITSAQLTLDSSKRIRAYNLGHPILALSKDLLVLDRAMHYEPDMIVWLTTLRSFPRDTQFDAPLVQRNADEIRRLFAELNLDYDLNDSRLIVPTVLERTLVGQRRELADWLHLQLYGVMWTITGIDQYYPDSYTPRTSDFDEDVSWEDLPEPQPLTEAELAFDLLNAGHQIAGGVPLLLVNEPIFISGGQNSDLRYNLWYPRWAYDQYRELYQSNATERGWHYLDLWDSIAAAEFTDSPVHLTPSGSRQLAERLGETLLTIANNEES